MHAAFPAVVTARKAGLIHGAVCAALAAMCIAAHAYQDANPLEHVVERLPELPGTADTPPGYFDFQGDSAELGYQSRIGKWSARFDQYLDMDPSVNVDYGLLLSNKLSAGGRFTRQDTFSEMVVNGVFAPQKNVRLRVTGAQLRNVGGVVPGSAENGLTVLQNSYLLNARKYWHKYRYLSDVGVTAFSTEATTPSMMPDELMDMESEQAMVGRKEGYMLNLGLRPTSRSRIDMRREFSHLSYYLGDDAHRVAHHTASRVRYSQYLDNCVRLQGGVSTSTDIDRLDLNIARNNWSVNLSHEQQGNNDSTAIRFGYTIPLGTRPSRSATCSGQEGLPSFEPIVDASVARPPQLPGEPLFMQMP